MSNYFKKERVKMKREILIKIGIVLSFIMLCATFCIFYLRLNLRDCYENDYAYLLRISWGSTAFSMFLFTIRSVLFGILAYIDEKKKSYRVGTLIIQGGYLVIAACCLVILIWRIAGNHDVWKVGQRFWDYKMGLVLLAVTQGMLQRIYHGFFVRFDIIKILLFGMIFLLFAGLAILAFLASLY